MSKMEIHNIYGNKSSINIYNDDCINFLSKANNIHIDAVITDPPYNIGFDDSKNNKFDEKWDHKTDEEFSKFNKTWLSAIDSITDNCIFVVFMASTQVDSFLKSANNSIKEMSLITIDTLYRQKGRGSLNKLKSLTENIIVFSKGDVKVNDSAEFNDKIANYSSEPQGWFVDVVTGERYEAHNSLASNYKNYTQPFFKSKSQPKIHNCQKSVILLSEYITHYSSENDTIFDPFMGSGSTGIASSLLNRNFIGVEKDKNMFLSAGTWLNDPNYNEFKKYIKLPKGNFVFGNIANGNVPLFNALVM
jgi:site-specific DNA-methyltransferase (adenine-specific)